MTDIREEIAPWGDADVQLVYAILCDGQEPPSSAEHWEGWVSRRIVAALRAERERGAPEELPETWAEKVARLREEAGRKLTLDELIAHARQHTMSPAEIEEQRASWVRAFTTPCEHGVLDFEQCPDCRAEASARLTR